MSHAAVMIIALAIDALVGWPDQLFARIGHPVTSIGALISGIEARWNRGVGWQRIVAGAACVAIVLSAAGVSAALVQSALPPNSAGLILTAIFAWPLIAMRSLHTHVAAVARPLAAKDLGAARGAVSMIVGRDPARLDAAGISRAGLESLAENTSDGVVAPVFWGLVAGLPGLAVYKAVNTLDSMIGHRNGRYEAFGKVAARLDDVANLIPARLTGLIFAVVSGRPAKALRGMVHDARRHRSPNAGWPEAAMAHALGIRLSGPRIYGTSIADEPWLNGAAPDPDAASVAAGLALYRRAMLAMVAGLGVLAFPGG